MSDVAIVLTVHHEGRALIPTVRALDRAIAAAPSLSVDVVVVCDRIDESTRRALAQVSARRTLRHAVDVVMIEVDNGDLSVSRNDGIASTGAPIVGVLDADNLPSENWIAQGFKALARMPEPAVVHPELIVTFGSKRETWRLIGSTDPAFDAGWLAWFNPWDAFALAHRSVFERFPYRPSSPGGGFGPEDWAWNCDTVAAGIPHVIAPSTTLFYHATGHGLAAAHGGSLLPQNDLLRDRDVARAALARMHSPAEEPHSRRSLRSRSRLVDLSWRAAAYYSRPLRSQLRRPPLRPIREELLHRRTEWAKAHELQPAVPYPSDEALRAYGSWGEDWDRLFIPEQRAYWTGVATLPPEIDVLVIAPWIRTGGADLLTLQYIASVRRTRPDAVIGLVTTEPESSTRLGEVENVTVFDLGQFRLLPQFGVRVLGTLLAQLRPHTVHVVNSTLGFDVLDRYGRALAMHSNLFASTFVIDRLPDGTGWSFLHHRSRDFYESVAAVLTDNEHLVDHMMTAEGAPASAFVVHHAVVDEQFRLPESRTITFDSPLRVVWAGRFDRQKRLDRLADIAESLQGDPVEFHAYGDAVIGDDPTLDETLARLDAAGVIRHPAYSEGFSEVTRISPDVLLLTSDREGLPNVLLEGMSSGLAVIAPNVGDISRVVHSETGYLVERPDDIAAYVNALNSIISGHAEALRRISSARALVEREYSAERLDRTLELLPGYLPRESGRPAIGWRWFTDGETAAVLNSGDALTLVYTGSNGHSNFGDILQNKNVLRYWSQRADRTPVLFLPAFAAVPAERIEALRRWFDCPHIVFFAPGRTECPEGLSTIDPSAVDAPVHVVGGGYLNAMWGDAHFDAIDAIATAFEASQVFFTGLQIDERALVGFERLADDHVIPFIGLRDSASLALAREQLSIAAVDTFDDLTEVLEDWSAPAEAEETRSSGLRVAIHMNTSDYAGGAEALAAWQEALAGVAEMQPSEVILLNAYADPRPEVRDTLGTVEALAEQFPFARVIVIDTARAALDWEPGSGLPSALRELAGVDFGLSSSYHTALMMSFLGIPAYLMGANAYFGQKAQLFDLPPLEEFLRNPSEFRLDVSEHLSRRHSWISRLDTMLFR